MIGTTLKLGFDGTSVSKGLKTVSGLLGKFGKEVAIGASRRVGEGVTDLLGKVITAVPQAISETMDWAGELADLGNQTGMATDKLVEFQELLRLTGVDSGSTGKMIFTMAKNVKDAAANGGDLADQLKAIGLSAESLAGLAPDEMFKRITERVGELNKTTVTPIEFKNPFSDKFGTKFVETTEKMENLEQLGSDLFGSKMGYKWIGVAKDFSGSMAQAKNNVSALGQAMSGGMAGKIDQMGDALGRFTNFKRSLSSMFVSEVMRATGSGGIDKIFNFLDPEKLRPQVQAFVSMLGRNLEVFLSQDFTKSLGDVMKNLGKSFGEGIKESIFGAKNPKSSTFLQKIGGAMIGASAQNTAPLIEDTNSILGDIRKNTTTAYFT
tara:strand:+ start:1339 stop:2478 length:1140 start_codon:yes stop_codon:yes gene_type:complete